MAISPSSDLFTYTIFVTFHLADFGVDHDCVYWISWNLSLCQYIHTQTYAHMHLHTVRVIFIYLFRWYWIHYTYIYLLFVYAFFELFCRSSCRTRNWVEINLSMEILLSLYVTHVQCFFCGVFCLLFLYVPRKNSLDNNTTNKKKGKFNWKTFVWMCQLPCMWNELLPKHRALNTMRLCRLLFLLWFSEFSPSL